MDDIMSSNEIFLPLVATSVECSWTPLKQFSKGIDEN